MVIPFENFTDFVVVNDNNSFIIKLFNNTGLFKTVEKSLYFRQEDMILENSITIDAAIQRGPSLFKGAGSNVVRIGDNLFRVTIFTTQSNGIVEVEPASPFVKIVSEIKKVADGFEFDASIDLTEGSFDFKFLKAIFHLNDSSEPFDATANLPLSLDIAISELAEKDLVELYDQDGNVIRYKLIIYNIPFETILEDTFYIGELKSNFNPNLIGEASIELVSVTKVSENKTVVLFDVVSRDIPGVEFLRIMFSTTDRFLFSEPMLNVDVEITNDTVDDSAVDQGSENSENDETDENLDDDVDADNSVSTAEDTAS